MKSFICITNFSKYILKNRLLGQNVYTVLRVFIHFAILFLKAKPIFILIVYLSTGFIMNTPVWGIITSFVCVCLYLFPKGFKIIMMLP